MRVLIVSQYFWPESFLINMVTARLAAEGMVVTVLTGKPNYPDGRIFDGYSALGTQSESYCGADIVRVPLIARGKTGSVRLALNYLSFIISASFLGPWLLRGRKYDVVFVYAPSPLLQAIVGMAIARIKGIPMLLWVQDLWPESISASGFIRNTAILKFLEVIVRWIYSSADRVLIQSRGFHDPIANMINGSSKIFYVPNSMPEGDKSEPTSSRSLDLVHRLNGGFSIVFAGNLGHAQGLDTLIEAAELIRAHSDINIFLVGSGRLDPWLEEQVRTRNLINVHLAGRYSPADMPEILNAASVLLVSLRDDPLFRLTIPNKLQAYMAAGRPILAVLGGEGSSIIEEAMAGLTCEPGDATMLADTILRFKNLQESALNSMGSAGKRYYDEFFSPQVLIESLTHHLEQSAEANKERPA